MKKLLIWDGDNSLWDGTILEDLEVSITPERAELCQTLRDRGVLQSIASHNLLQDVLAVIAKYGLEDCFLVPQANLDAPKSVMIKIIMNELGLVKNEDVVFVDDEQFNLEEVEKSLPDLCAMRPEYLKYVIEPWFSKETYTDDDRNRVRRYRSEQDRKKASTDYQGEYLDFLRQCDMRACVRTPTEQEMDRVIDLIRRANQLSLLSAEFSATTLRTARQNLVACWSKDKFGDNGMVGVAFVIPWDNYTLHTINILVISCRMQGKGIGSYLLGSILNRISPSEVKATFKATEYNKSMVQLLEYFGFTPQSNLTTDVDGMLCYGLKAAEPVELPDWIKPL